MPNHQMFTRGDLCEQVVSCCWNLSKVCLQVCCDKSARRDSDSSTENFARALQIAVQVAEREEASTGNAKSKVLTIKQFWQKRMNAERSRGCHGQLLVWSCCNALDLHSALLYRMLSVDLCKTAPIVSNLCSVRHL